MCDAVLAACEAYAALELPFALVGGLAAGAHGRPRFTKDVNFLVGAEAFTKRGMIISFTKPMPLQAGDVAIDSVPLPEQPHRKAVLTRALQNVQFDTTMGRSIPILDATALCYMKLASLRGRDRDDIVAMMQAGHVDVLQLTSLADEDAELRERLSQALAELEIAEQ